MINFNYPHPTSAGRALLAILRFWHRICVAYIDYNKQEALMLSERVQKIKPSATLQLTGKVAELKRNGTDIISFNVGEPDFGTPANICDAAIEAIRANFTKYTPVSGIPELREAICKKLKDDNNVEYAPSEISVGTGAKQPLVNAILTICGSGDEVILPTPCWVSYEEMIKLSEAKPVFVPTNESQGFALDLEAIARALTPKTKAILINTPNNPTGAVYSEESLRKLAAMAAEHDFYIISDEVYEKLIYDGEKHFCVASISPEVKKRCIVVNGFSKAYAMTGWRMGYVAASKEIIDGVNAIQGHMTSAANSITQKACIEALTGPQDSLEAMRLEFDKRRLYLLKRLNMMEGISCVNAKGAFYLMPNVSGLYGKTSEGKVLKDSLDVADFLLDKAHIAVVPGAAFEAPDNLRISYSNSLDNIMEGMDRMEEALKSLK